MAANRRARLVLWDIDHTLIESRGVGRAIYERVFPEVVGQPLRELATVHGRTELDIMHDTLQLHDVEPTDNNIHRLATALAEGYHAAADELASRGRTLPGVWQALEALHSEPGFHQSVLTGNITAVARVKVAAFGLDRFLDLAIGAYGDDDRERSGLVDIARERAVQRLGAAISVEQVVLIGDTPADVAAAIASGAHIVAVASGTYTVEDLRAAGADTTLANLSNLTQLRQALAR